MNEAICIPGACKCNRRILVVDNDPEDRADNVKCLRDWGFEEIYIAQGKGLELIRDAKEKAQEHRCHLALVDMRLRDNEDPDDHSGLTLLSDLYPTRTILVTGFGDMYITRRALLEKGAIDVVGKQESLSRLRSAIAIALSDSCGHNLTIFWPPRWDETRVAAELSRDNEVIHVDEIRDVLVKLFPKAQKLKIEHLGGALNSPLKTRRHRNSVVFAVFPDGLAPVVLKIATAARVRTEVQNYERYVDGHMQGFRSSQLRSHCELWSVGGMMYSLIGGALQQHQVCSFSDKFRQADNTLSLQKMFREFFTQVWETNYDTHEITGGSLLQEYHQIWANELHELYDDNTLDSLLAAWKERDQYMTYAVLVPIKVLDPYRWIADHYSATAFSLFKRAVIHGDLHGNNLLVDDDYHPWVIDFGRTCRGYLLFDISEITQYILTKLLDEQYPLSTFYVLVLACIDPSPERATHFADLHMGEDFAKAYVLINELRQIAEDKVMYTDRREYLWAILLEAIFVNLILPEDDPRRSRLQFLAGIICSRLNGWGQPSWIPIDWPTIKECLRSQPFASHRKGTAVQVIKVLFLAANPLKMAHLQLDEEIRAIDAALLRSRFRDRFVLLSHWAVRVDEIQELLLRHEPTIVHFSGHGNSNGEIILMNRHGQAQPIAPDSLRALFRQLKEQVRCVVLNTCFVSGQALGIAEEIDAVVGSTSTLEDQAAISFSVGFYRSLAHGYNVQAAFELGCVEVNLTTEERTNTFHLLAHQVDPKQLYFL